jgi:hypothetical protein
LMEPQVRTRNAGGGVQLDAGPTPVDGPPGKNKEGLVEEMVKNRREEFSLMLDQLQWMDPQLITRKGWWRRW